MFSPSLQSLPKTATISTKKNSHKTSHLDIYTKYIALLLFVMSCLLSLQGKPARKCLKMTQKSQHRRRKNCSSWFLSKKSFSQGSKKNLTWHHFARNFPTRCLLLISLDHSRPFLIQKGAKKFGEIRRSKYKNFDIYEKDLNYYD